MRLGKTVSREKGLILEVSVEVDATQSIKLDCGPEMIPAPGEYLLAHDPGAIDSFLPVSLFVAGDSSQGNLQVVSSSLPNWQPGTQLALRGPLGRGYRLPADIRKLALAALGETTLRLLPLLHLCPDADIAIFTDAALPQLSPKIEINPLELLPDALSWASFLALDIPYQKLDSLRQILGLVPHERPPCPSQALISIPMPCGALADCSVCAVPARRGYKLACKDGPVFDLNNLRW
jgi:hypothetical protein